MGMQKSAICHQILRNLLKAVYILIPCFLTNFLITESILSLRNTEILCVAIVFNSDDWLKSFNKNKHPLKMKFKNILFCRLPFCGFTHSLCENENIPM